ncbi:hypothetical protein [Moorena sp. SIO3A2]|uniref:hypothetical protein n=1 Tax=Moorena sp. SIO3A2 TaxID=2607841 RepID=UPI0013BE5394|nr:hypothetical protein [Moorena sp. SIO3A2]NER90375.1 hypothetical protein [Moorena sp. SIO3A2]
MIASSAVSLWFERVKCFVSKQPVRADLAKILYKPVIAPDQLKVHFDLEDEWELLESITRRMGYALDPKGLQKLGQEMLKYSTKLAVSQLKLGETFYYLDDATVRGCIKHILKPLDFYYY